MLLRNVQSKGNKIALVPIKKEEKNDDFVETFLVAMFIYFYCFRVSLPIHIFRKL